MPEILEPAPVAAEPAEPLPAEPKVAAEKSGLRFAEDILGPRPDKTGDKAKKKKKVAYAKEGAEDGIRIKRRRRDTDLLDEDEEL